MPELKAQVVGWFTKNGIAHVFYTDGTTARLPQGMVIRSRGRRRR